MAQILLPTREAAAPREEKKESAMDKLLKGLQIANSAFGIASNVSNIASQSQARGIAEAKEGREAAKFGLETQRTTMQAPEGAPGTELTLKTPEGDDVTSLRVPKPLDPDARKKADTELAQLRVKKAKAELRRGPINEKAFTLSPEQRDYFINERGISEPALAMVEAGHGGRNPVNTLNMIAERDEPTAAEITTINDFDTTDEILDDIVASAKEDWIGPVRGRIPGVAVGAEESAWRGKVGRLNDAYRKAITGMGASQQEIETLMTRLPSENDRYDQFVAKSKWLDNEIDQKRKIYISNLQRGGKFMKHFMEPKSTLVVGQKLQDQQVSTLPPAARQSVQTAQGRIAVDDNSRNAALQELQRRKSAASNLPRPAR